MFDERPHIGFSSTPHLFHLYIVIRSIFFITVIYTYSAPAQRVCTCVCRIFLLRFPLWNVLTRFPPLFNGSWQLLFLIFPRGALRWTIKANLVHFPLPTLFSRTHSVSMPRVPSTPPFLKESSLSLGRALYFFYVDFLILGEPPRCGLFHLLVSAVSLYSIGSRPHRDRIVGSSVQSVP